MYLTKKNVIFTIKLNSIEFSNSLFLLNVSMLVCLLIFFFQLFSWWNFRHSISRELNIQLCSVYWRSEKSKKFLSFRLFFHFFQEHGVHINFHILLLLLLFDFHWNLFVGVQKLKVFREHCISMLSPPSKNIWTERVNFHWKQLIYVFGTNDTQGINRYKFVIASGFFSTVSVCVSFQYQLKRAMST